MFRGRLVYMYTGNGIHGWRAYVRCIGGEGLVRLNFSTRYGIAVWPGVHIFCVNEHYPRGRGAHY